MADRVAVFGGGPTAAARQRRTRQSDPSVEYDDRRHSAGDTGRLAPAAPPGTTRPAYVLTYLLLALITYLRTYCSPCLRAYVLTARPAYVGTYVLTACPAYVGTYVLTYSPLATYVLALLATYYLLPAPS